MNRAQRRAAARGRGHLLEVCLAGCCAPARRATGSVEVWELNDGTYVVACPSCDFDVPAGDTMPVAGHQWMCPYCERHGVLVD